MKKPIFKNGDRCKMIAGPYKGKEITIEGDCNKIFNVKTLDEAMSPGKAPAAAVATYFVHINEMIFEEVIQTKKDLNSHPKNIIRSAALRGEMIFVDKYSGPFYYGKVDEIRNTKTHYLTERAVRYYEGDEFQEKMPCGVCVHPSWLEEIEQK